MKYDIFSVVTTVVEKKNWSGFNQPKLRDLGPLSDKKLETGNNKLWLVESSQIIWKWLGDAGGFPPFMATSFAHQSQAHPCISVCRASRSSWKVLAKFLWRTAGKKNDRSSAAHSASSGKAHVWGFEYDMMWYDVIMWYIIQDIGYKYVYIYNLIYVIYCGMWYNVNTICIKVSTLKQIDISRHTESSQTSLPTTIYAQQWSFVFWLHPLVPAIVSPSWSQPKMEIQDLPHLPATLAIYNALFGMKGTIFGIKSPNSLGKGPVFYRQLQSPCPSFFYPPSS